jgi:hypothetical protein
MKKLAAVAAVATAVALTHSFPSQAASPTYHIQTTRASAGADGSQVFWAGRCNAALVGSPADGIDTAFVPVNGLGGRTLQIQWSGDATLAQTALGVGLIPHVWDANCNEISPAPPASGVNPGIWTITLNSRAAWLTVTSNGVQGVAFSYTVQ